ncbi:hypothetical protein, partial [Candidatus Avelusimicrobium faecicola]|uniref:hypothetical protein n=1 Tax=Candidatus Avelusimicrobium faecicola TaxID=3416205 RepID=UPI003D1520E7
MFILSAGKNKKAAFSSSGGRWVDLQKDKRPSLQVAQGLGLRTPRQNGTQKKTPFLYRVDGRTHLQIHTKNPLFRAFHTSIPGHPRQNSTQKKTPFSGGLLNGAGEENRTLVSTL